MDIVEYDFDASFNSDVFSESSKYTDMELFVCDFTVLLLRYRRILKLRPGC